MVLAGAGVDHEDLVRLGEKYFGGLSTGAASAADVPDSKYSGGESRITVDGDKVRCAWI